jgi:hypothetical protein
VRDESAQCCTYAIPNHHVVVTIVIGEPPTDTTRYTARAIGYVPAGDTDRIGGSSAGVDDLVGEEMAPPVAAVGIKKVSERGTDTRGAHQWENVSPVFQFHPIALQVRTLSCYCSTRFACCKWRA